MADLAEALPRRLRETGLVDAGDALNTTRPSGAVMVTVPSRREHRWDAVRQPRLLGVRLGVEGQASAWATLPGDGMGPILDETALPGQVAGLLRLIGQLRVDPTTMLSVGQCARLPRTSATMLSVSDQPLRLEPDECVTLAALDRGAQDVGRVLTRALLEALTARL
jgi:hypothetical protein